MGVGGGDGTSAHPASSAPESAISQGVVAVGVERPVVVFAPGAVRVSKDLDEALVQREVVSDRVPPSGVGAAEELELPHQEVVDLGERQSMVRSLSDRHDDQGDVRERRLPVALVRTWSGDL